MHTLSDPQRQILDDLVAGLSVRDIAERRTITRQRCQAQIEALRAKGLLTDRLPDDCLHRETHPQGSRADPWPAAARWLRLFPGTDHEIVLRSVLLPRSDGAELPAGLPDTRVITILRPGHEGSLSWEISRRNRWTVDNTAELYTDWVTRAQLQSCGRRPLRLVVPPAIGLDDERLRMLTLAVAWVVGTEAILHAAGG